MNFVGFSEMNYMGWMILLWIVLGLLGLLFAYMLLIIISSFFADPHKAYDKNSRYYRFLLNSATGLATVIIRIKLKVTGIEQLPQGRFLLVGNHRSKFDPILTWYVFRKYDLAFISKYENFEVPFFGRIIRKCCFMGIDRENPRKAAKTIIQSVKLIKSDECSVAVYPEGTRNYGDGLLPFHNAVLKIAQKAEVPIVVLVVEGADAIQHNFPKRKSVVHLDIVKVIPADEVKEKTTAELGEDIEQSMLCKLKEYEQ